MYRAAKRVMSVVDEKLEEVFASEEVCNSFWSILDEKVTVCMYNNYVVVPV